jgi:phospholipid/cholesterol/gamma-HCH transport system permease protein
LDGQRLSLLREKMDPIASVSAGIKWSTRREEADTVLVVVLTSNWAASESGELSSAAGDALGPNDTRLLRFDATNLGRWDSSLLVFLSSLRLLAAQRKIAFDDSGLPLAARKLLASVPAQEPTVDRAAVRHGFVERLGFTVSAGAAEGVAITTLVGDQLLRARTALAGRARMRLVDLFSSMYEAGIAALPMVALVNVLVGAILAFVGAVQLRRFGADIYIANLVGVAEIREMAAVMTAIVIAGRTGAAYAAEIAAMQGTEELDALRVIGIPVQEYLILPRALSLTLMMPVLYLYASAVGILGGLVVAVATLNLSAQNFIEQTRAAVSFHEVVFGLIKSLTFGALIAITGCRIGLKAGRSAMDVGHAATTAVVAGIVGVIALDALFAVCANAMGI